MRSKKNIKLIFDGQKICFQSEQDLESYIEHNFDVIFPGLMLLARQSTVFDRRCDLLCCKKSNKQAVIIELKNQEDRYIVTQLTRYHRSLLSVKPFVDRIDYSLPIELIAIAPNFHPENYGDKEYSKLETQIHFYQFSIEQIDRTTKFSLLGRYIEIDHPILGLSDPASIQPIELNLLSAAGQFYQTVPSEHRSDFLKLHSLFISQPGIKYWASNNYRRILYGTGAGENHHKLAEINYGSKNPYLYLWLPTAVRTRVKIPIARFGLVYREGDNPISLNSEVEWLVCTKNNISLKDKPKSLSEGHSFNRHGMLKWCSAKTYLSQATSTSIYTTLDLLMYLMKNIERPFSEADWEWWNQNSHPTPTNLGWFVDLAIKTWQYRRSH